MHPILSRIPLLRPPPSIPTDIPLQLILALRPTIPTLLIRGPLNRVREPAYPRLGDILTVPDVLGCLFAAGCVDGGGVLGC